MDVTSRDGAFAESNVAAFTRSRAAFDLKGVMSSLTVLRLRSRDLNLIERQLRAKVTQFPQFFQGAPIILDVGELEGGVEGFPLAALVRALSVSKVVPVAVTNLDESHRHLAAAAGLGIVNLSAARPAGDPEAVVPGDGAAPAREQTPAPREQQSRDQQRENQALQHAREIQIREHQLQQREQQVQLREQQAREAEAHAAQSQQQMRTPTPTPAQGQPAVAAQGGPAARPGAHRAPMVIRQPVRSGQLIYAEKNDLIVLAPVNPGAQIVADGNIHVYATLRGRAVAGAQGYTDARIFCQKFEAELVAIAGAHVTFDDIPRDRLGKPSQVHLQNGVCVISGL